MRIWVERSWPSACGFRLDRLLRAELLDCRSSEIARVLDHRVSRFRDAHHNRRHSGIFFFFSAALLLERLGRKPTTAGFLILSAAAAFAYGHAIDETALFVTGFVMQFFMFGMWSCLYAYTPELYPTRARSTGAGFASAFGRIGAIAGPLLVPALVVKGGAGIAFQVGAGGFLIAALLVIVLGVETKGRVLETISR